MPKVANVEVINKSLVWKYEGDYDMSMRYRFMQWLSHIDHPHSESSKNKLELLKIIQKKPIDGDMVFLDNLDLLNSVMSEYAIAIADHRFYYYKPILEGILSIKLGGIDLDTLIGLPVYAVYKDVKHEGREIVALKLTESSAATAAKVAETTNDKSRFSVSYYYEKLTLER